MELKLKNTAPLALRAVGSNRTFMELKFVSAFQADTERRCSNRTFMELKVHIKSV